MNIAFYISKRIAINKQKSFSGFIIRLSLIATIISVMVMIITVAFTEGFQENIENKIYNFWGHIRIQEKQPDKTAIAEELPIIENDSIKNEILKLPEVESIQPFATKYAIVKSPTEFDGILFKATDNNFSQKYFSSFLKKGRWLHFTDSTYSREIVISEYTSKLLQLNCGDKLTIYFIRPDGGLRPDKLTVVGIYSTNIDDYDKTYAIGDLRLLQRLNGWENYEIGGYEVFLNSNKNINSACDKIYNLSVFPPVWDAKNIREVYPNLFDWLALLNTPSRVLIAIMAIVAFINMISCIVILILNRINMIGILKSVGYTNWTIQKIFLQYSFFITLLGIAIGTLLALGFIWLQQATGFIQLNPSAYFMTTASAKIVWWQIVLIDVCTLLISILILLIPTWIIAKLQPVRALRFD